MNYRLKKMEVQLRVFGAPMNYRLKKIEVQLDKPRPAELVLVGAQMLLFVFFVPTSSL